MAVSYFPPPQVLTKFEVYWEKKLEEEGCRKLSSKLRSLLLHTHFALQILHLIFICDRCRPIYKESNLPLTLKLQDGIKFFTIGVKPR